MTQSFILTQLDIKYLLVRFLGFVWLLQGHFQQEIFKYTSRVDALEIC